MASLSPHAGTAPRIVILSGAGLSAESGLGTFRDPDGLWAKFDPMELATPEAFQRNPVKVHEFYNLRRADLLKATPNAAHHALARLSQDIHAAGGRVSLVTQNIDNLLENAGATDVLHMHGELLKARCGSLDRDHDELEGCGAVFDRRTDLSTGDACPKCGAMGPVRPHVVWFGEVPLLLEQIAARLAEADVFVSIGTSGTVWPAAGFVAEARRLGVATVELNLEPSDGGSLFDEARYGPATDVVPAWVDEVLGA